jgi:hypothetical protein
VALTFGTASFVENATATADGTTASVQVGE